MDAGIPLDAADFFADLEMNNTREWFTANKARWQASVRTPLQALVDALAEEFGAAKLFRPNRDVRFSLDKSPYKIHQGAVVDCGPGVGYYVQVSASGLMTGCGWYMATPAQIAAYRAAVLGEGSGARLAAAIEPLVADGFEVGGDQLKTAPRGVDPEHPRISLLRHRSLLLSREYGAPSWMETGEVVARVRDDWRAYRPVMEWLAEALA
ncbi:MAG: TIGR02453 family protein [Actinobacteria bacterium HGW-Actinobacteria-2]|nr:MAG: TIGR02453 family protein [Actinobacteria bacterium HGW-Actinobacteria-2]